jgi:RNA polymerase sigma-70 factor, ECF subfamily
VFHAREEAPVADKSTFDDFYLETRHALLRQLTAMTADPELAADVLQEAYSRAWQRWGRVSGMADPPAWVRTVAWRLAVSHFRRAGVARRFAGVIGRRPEDAEAMPQDEVLDVQAALRLLPPEHRRVLVLHDLCDLPVTEVAAETGVPEGTVKSRLSRARDKLAAVLGENYPGPNPREQREGAV